MATRKKADKLTFEEGLAQMEALVEQMEQGQMTLDQSLESYENGMALYEKLSQMLAQGQARMEMIRVQKENDEPADTQPLQMEEEP